MCFWLIATAHDKMIKYVVYYRVKGFMYKTNDVIKKTATNRETLRFYESKGLLPSLLRTEAGYRIYPESIISRLHFIQSAKDAGFTLVEIKELIQLQQGQGTCRKGRDLAKLKRDQINQKIRALKKMDKLLNHFIKKCEENGEKGLRKKCHVIFESLN